MYNFAFGVLVDMKSHILKLLVLSKSATFLSVALFFTSLTSAQTVNTKALHFPPGMSFAAAVFPPGMSVSALHFPPGMNFAAAVFPPGM